MLFLDTPRRLEGVDSKFKGVVLTRREQMRLLLDLGMEGIVVFRVSPEGVNSFRKNGSADKFSSIGGGR